MLKLIVGCVSIIYGLQQLVFGSTTDSVICFALGLLLLEGL